MNMVDRIKNICLTPKTEWDVIEPEQSDTQSLFMKYLAPLAGIYALATFISTSLIGTSTFLGTIRHSIAYGIGAALISFVFLLIGVLILSIVINQLAPSFDAQKNTEQSMKLAAYSVTPAWIAGVFQLIPFGTLLMLLAAGYTVYILYLGIPKLMKCPEDKAVGYTAVVAIIVFVIGVVVGTLTTCVVGLSALATGAATGSLGSRSKAAEVTFDKDSALGKLDTLGKKLEESNKKMEAAQKSGDQSAQVAAAMEVAGTLFGGGKRAEPIGIEELKPLLPETLAGLAKKSSRSEKTGIAGFMISKADATYGEGDKTLSLDITDTGGAGGLMALASWVNVQGEKEDDFSREKTGKVDGRFVQEKMSKKGGTHEYSVLVGERFMVSVKGRGVSFDEVKGAAKSIDLAKLESMKNVGAVKQ
jgi:Yip1 domain